MIEIDAGLVSVIIPVYNVESYLVEALESIVGQSYENLEIIIVDDGSTDGCAAICDEYKNKDRRVRVIHQENKGLSSARNTGLNYATGNWIAFLDSDDSFHFDFVKELMDAIIRNKAEIGLCKYIIERTEGRMNSHSDVQLMPAITEGVYDRVTTLKALADGTINQSIWNKIYNRKLWEGIRFPVGHVYEDVDVTYRVLDRCQKICVIDRLLYIKRSRPGSITDTYSMKNAIDNLRALNHFISYVEDNTPETFDEKHLIRIQDVQMNLMMSAYIRFYQKEGTDTFCKKIRRHIIATGKRQNIKRMKRRTLVVYNVICYCPWLIPVLLPIHNYVKYYRNMKWRI